MLEIFLSYKLKYFEIAFSGVKMLKVCHKARIFIS